MEGLWNIKDVMECQEDVHNKLEGEPDLTSSPTRGPEPACSQIESRGVSELRFTCSTYAWKCKMITFGQCIVWQPIWGSSRGFNMNPRTLDSL
jgi:hypothetical protein